MNSDLMSAASERFTCAQHMPLKLHLEYNAECTSWVSQQFLNPILNVWGYTGPSTCLTVITLRDWTGPIMLIVLFLVSQFNFLFVPCGGLSWLPVSFLLHVKYTLSYRTVTWTFYIFHKIFYVILVHLLLVVFSKQRKSRHNGCKNTNKLHWVQWTQHWFSYVKSLIHLQLEIGSCLVKESWVCHISSYSATSGWKFRHFWTCVRGVLLKRW